MTCGAQKPSVKYKGRDGMQHQKETQFHSSSTKTVGSGKSIGVSHGPRAKGASPAGGGLTASSCIEHINTVNTENASHFKRGLN